MEIINLIFLIFGVFLIILGTSLVILHYKRKYPEKELTYKWSFNTFLVGILCIIGVITDTLGVILLLGVIFGIFTRYAVKKYLAKYNFLSFSIWEIVFFISIILMVLIISAFYFN